MEVDLKTHLSELGLSALCPFSYQTRGGAVGIGTTSTIAVTIGGGNDFCCTDIWVFMKNAGALEGFDFSMRDVTNNIEFQNRTMPLDTGTATRPKVPIQTVPGEPSMLKLPWIIPANTQLEFTGYARYVAATSFDVILSGYKLNSAGARPPYQPFVYLFNGSVDDVPAGTYNRMQEVIVNGPSDFICTLISSNWDRSAVNVDIRELLSDATQGRQFTRKQIEGDRILPRPYYDSFETSFPLPFLIKSGTALRRQISNVGTVAERRPELFVFGWWDVRTAEQKKASSFYVQ